MDLLGENKGDLQMMFLYDLYSNQVNYDYSLHDLYTSTTGMAQVCLWLLLTILKGLCNVFF